MPSSDIAVSARGLSKSYTIAHNTERHTSVAEVLMHRLKNPRQRMEKETFWALKDIEFDIKRGDVVGIIGRNGAGKSTLLKVLSRITEPTTGQIDLYGRVGSLLEVGTGFHPELTGRENVFLNGAILGMTRKEIAREFDAIVDFSGTEKFLDTPVKRYSSGMYVRLAFAVAAHLNPEILIIDEVLAVGDAEFQKKCMGKMKDVAKSGRTILFVSHQEAAIRTLCTSAILLSAGTVVATGTPDEVYEQYRVKRTTTGFSTANRTMSCPELQCEDAYFSYRGIDTSEIPSGAQPHLTLVIRVNTRCTFTPEVVFRNSQGIQVLFGCLWYTNGKAYTFDPGVYHLTYKFDLPHLVTGRYSIDFVISDPTVRYLEFIEDALDLYVTSAISSATGFKFDQSHGRGCVYMAAEEIEVTQVSDDYHSDYVQKIGVANA